jgi:anti-sigma B factor antagonist
MSWPIDIDSNSKKENPMKCSQREVGGVTILEPKGKITIGAGDVALRAVLEETISGDKSKILLDLKGVKKMDSSGLGELIAAHNSVTEAGGAIKLMNLPPKLHGVLGITQIVSVFDVFDDEREALASFR